MGKKRLYVAYGSNLNLGQMARRCPGGKVAGKTELRDYELVFRGGGHSSVATIEPKKGAAVPVLVWDIKPEDEAALDRYEGYPSLYGKEMVGIELDGKKAHAMVYVMTLGHMAGQPGRYYLDIIKEGYQDAGFDKAVLDAAIKRSEEIRIEEQEAAQVQDDPVKMRWQ